MKDFLEPEVDEKYYINTDKARKRGDTATKSERLMRWTKKKWKFVRVGRNPKGGELKYDRK